MGSGKISILWLFCTVVGAKCVREYSKMRNSIKICEHYRRMTCGFFIEPYESIWTFRRVFDTTPSAKVNTKKKKVSFSRIAQIVLIPTRKEYVHMFSDLWYKQEDFNKFRWEYTLGFD